MLVLWLALTGCDQPVRLAEAPTLYAVGMAFPAAEVPPAQQSVDAPIFYATDRAPMMRDGAVAGYGFERSNSVGYGTARVRFDTDGGWAGLVARSQSGASGREALTILSYDEAGRLPETPLPKARQYGRAVPDPAALATYRAGIADFQRAFAARLARTPQKEAVVFVHGFNSEMEDALATSASLWHFAGRQGVPVLFSWPAGNPGLTAYLKDRESGEFAVYHLKEVLRALAAVPELRTIRIVAHSRGADVTTSALRELAIFEMGAGRDPRRALKIDTLILAAPDLDFGVVQQRLGAEGTAEAVGQVNVYLNPRDGALGLAQVLATGTRIGRLSPDTLSEEDWARMGDLGNVHFIDVEGAGGRIGHVYFRDNPAVLSDVILAMRTGALPGGEQRPLENVRSNFWRLHPNYPGPRIVAEVVANSDR